MKVYADIKRNGEIGTTDEQRSNMFADHMESVCKPLEGTYYDNDYRIKVNNIINKNPKLFKPSNEPEKHDESLLNSDEN